MFGYIPAQPKEATIAAWLNGEKRELRPGKGSMSLYRTDSRCNMKAAVKGGREKKKTTDRSRTPRKPAQGRGLPKGTLPAMWAAAAARLTPPATVAEAD